MERNPIMIDDGRTAGERFLAGILPENPVYRQLLGMCPTLAVTGGMKPAMTMAAATAFVLISANIMISLIRGLLRPHLRILVFTLTIATFVTIADRVLAAYLYQMSKQLGPYVPLIIVNCIIICRAEACASKNGIVVSIIDAVGMGIGFTLTLCVLAGIRELLATGAVFEVPVLAVVKNGGWFVPWAAMGMPVGAFITLGLMLGLVNLITSKKA